MKKILIITYYWPPSGGAGVQRWLKFSKYLPEWGYQPIILTVDEKWASYAQWDPTLLKEISPDIKVYKTKTFEPYNLYKKLSNKKEIPYGGFSNQKKIGWMEKISRFLRGNFFIPDPRRGWNSYALQKAKELIRTEPIHTVITTGPPHSTHLIGKKLKIATGIRWIADFRDPWTDIYYYKELFHAPLAAKWDRSLERKVLEKADRIITVSKEVGKLLEKKIEGLSSKLAIIPNGYDEADFQEVKVLPVSQFTITYTGTISMSYRIENWIEAICLLPNSIKNQLKIRFVGNVPEEINRLFQLKGIESKVEVIGYVPHNKAIEHMTNSSLLLMAIPDTPDNKGIVTGKFFEYLATGKPILAIGPKAGEVEMLLQQCTAGQLFSYNDTEGMRQYMSAVFEQYQEGNWQSKTSGAVNFTRRNLTKELVKNL